MEGRPLAERIRAQVAEDVRELGAIGLATVQVGEDEASTIYLRLKHQAASEVEIASVDRKLPHTISEEEVLEEVAALNADDAIDGILLQLPLPEHIDEARVIAAVDAVKDVDGFHPFNAGQLYLGRPTHVPATPLGVMALLAEYNVRLDGARAVVVGRSTIVGKPVAHLLLQAHATVTICHSHTDDLGAGHAGRGRARRGGRRARDRHGGHGQGRLGGRRRRDQPHRERHRRRRRPGRRDARRLPHASSRRRGADDDRDAAAEHRARGPIPPGPARVPVGRRSSRLTRVQGARPIVLRHTTPA